MSAFQYKTKKLSSNTIQPQWILLQKKINTKNPTPTTSSDPWYNSQSTAVKRVVPIISNKNLSSILLWTNYFKLNTRSNSHKELAISQKYPNRSRNICAKKNWKKNNIWKICKHHTITTQAKKKNWSKFKSTRSWRKSENQRNNMSRQ